MDEWRAQAGTRGAERWSGPGGAYDDEREDWRAGRTGSPAGAYAGRGPRGYRRSDARILEDVCDRLTEHGDLDASGVEVEVRDGEVHLTGTVSDRPSRRLAEEIAEGVAGVRDVVNRLRAAQPLIGGWADRGREVSPDRPRHVGEERVYQAQGAGGLSYSDVGLAASDEAPTGGRIGTWAGGAHSTGGMTTGMAIGSDEGLLGTTTGRGTGTYEAGRSGDLVEGSLGERGAPLMGATSGSGASVGGGATSSGGATAPAEPSPSRRAPSTGPGSP